MFVSNYCIYRCSELPFTLTLLHCLLLLLYWVCLFLPSLLWLGVRKCIWPVKIAWWGVGMVICLEQVQIVCIWSSWCHCHPRTPSSLAPFKSRLVLPFQYRLTQVVLKKRLLTGVVVAVVVATSVLSFCHVQSSLCLFSVAYQLMLVGLLVAKCTSHSVSFAVVLMTNV